MVLVYFLVPVMMDETTKYLDAKKVTVYISSLFCLLYYFIIFLEISYMKLAGVKL